MMRSSATPDTNSTWSSRPSRRIVSDDGPPSLRRPMTTRWASGRSVRTLASASSRKRRPLRVTSAEAVVISRPGTTATSGRGRNTSTSTPTGTTCTRAGSSRNSAHQVPGRALRDGDDAGQALRHPGLHAGEAVPARLREPLPAGAGVLPLEAPVDGDGVMDGGQDRQPVPLHAHQAVAQALVVVDDVEAPPDVSAGSSGPAGRRPAARGRRRWRTAPPPASRSTGAARRSTGSASGRGRCRCRGSGGGAAAPARRGTGYGWPPRTSTWWPRSTSAFVRCRV